MSATRKLTSDGNKKLDEMMQANLQLLPLIVDNIPQAVFWKDRNLVYIGCNQAFADDAGFSSPEDVIGKTDADMPWVDQVEAYQADDRQVMKSGTSKLNYEEPQTTPDGATIWLRTSKIPVHENGKVVAVLGMYEDITASKQAEFAIRESEERFRRFTEATVEGLVFHEDGSIVDVNPATVNMFGFSEAEDLIGRHLFEFIVPDFHDTVLEQMKLDSVQPYEIQCVRKDGSIFPVETSTRAYKVSGRTIRASSIRDISNRRKAEHALQESQQRLQGLYENSRDAIQILDNNLFVECNQATVEILHAKNKEEVLSTHPGKLSPEFQPDGRRSEEKANEMIQIALENGGHAFEWVHQRLDGENFPVEVLLTPVKLEDKTIFYSAWRDIAERKRLEAELQNAFEKRGYQVQVSTEIAQEISTSTELRELFDRVVTLTKERLGYYHTQLLRYDPGRDAVVLISGYGETGQKMLEQGHNMPMGSGLIGTAADAGETVMRPVLADDPDWKPNPLLPGTKGEIAVPIKLGDLVLGVLDVQSDKAGAITEDDRWLLEGLCGQIAIAMDQTRLRQEMAERLEEIDRLYRSMSREGWKDYQETGNIPAGFMFDRTDIRPVEDTSLADELFANVPLSVPSGEVIGEIAVANDPQDPMSPDDLNFLEQASEQIALAIESARLFEQTQVALGEVQESQLQLAETMKIANMANWEFDLQSLNFYFNDQYYRVLGTSVEEIGGYEVSAEEFLGRFVYPEDAPTIQSAIQNALQSNDPNFRGHLEYRTMGGKNTFGYGLVEYRLAFDENGKPVRAFGSHLDITERKLAEEATAKRAQELATVADVSTTVSTVLDPDELLQSVVDLTKERFDIYHAHIYLADESWGTLLLAAGAGEIGRLMVEEQHAIPMDAKISVVARSARERRAIILNNVRSEPSFLANPLLPETRAEMAVPMVVGDKVLGVFDVQADEINHFTQEDANIYTTLATQIGVALQNARLYMEQTATVAQLRELDRLKTSFLANMSHELRTPLNSILGFSDVILEGLDGPLTENMDNDVRLIQKNGRHLLNLINDVLDMAKIEAGKMNLAVEKFNLHEIIEEVTSITAPLASERSLSLFIEPESEQDLEIAADRTRLRQVMINLVNNAIKFTDKGKISILAKRDDKDFVLIRVKDTGIGIPEEQLESIFQEFTQVDVTTTRKVGGTGLGLPISRRLIEMHGGQLWAESTGVTGEGSTFYVRMPITAKVNEGDLELVS
jgi:PAS domain S-box-containing protein